ncbi:MAG: DNA adenine methylase [Chthoniobacterales bacterium]
MQSAKSIDFVVAPPVVDGKTAPRVKPPFGYYGAKQKIASRIIKMMPPHHAWVEAFCGSSAITFAKKQVPIEVINDKNGEIVNLFEQLRNNCDELCRAITLTPYAREEFLKARVPDKRLSRVQRARRFLVTSMMTVNGTQTAKCGFSFSSSYVRQGTEARVSRWNNLPERLARVAERLRHVRIENRDARELMQMFLNRPATLVYLDPPYFVKREHEYVIDANNRAFHEELLKLCCKAKCMILLSGYDTPLYKAMLNQKRGWQRQTIETHTRDTSGRDYARTEVLWMNRHFAKAVEAKKVPITLTKDEREENKLNPERP